MADADVEKDVETAVFSVDREKVTPFLIRVFVNHRAHLGDEKYADPTNLPKEGQIHIHTWLDATLCELKKLLAQVLPQFSQPQFGAEVSFALVYPDRKGRMVVKQSGTVMHSHSKSTSQSQSAQRGQEKAKTMDELKTLKELKFEIGDFLDVAITPTTTTQTQTHGHSYRTRNGHGRDDRDGRRRYANQNGRQYRGDRDRDQDRERDRGARGGGRRGGYDRGYDNRRRRY